MATYSFMDVQATITGPGGTVPLGYSAAVAEEGITIEPSEDKDTMVTGADGRSMHTLHAGRQGTITVRLLKTSPANALLQAMYDLQSSSSVLWGLNTIVVAQLASGDVTTATSVAFRRRPTLTYAKEGGMNEWSFNVGYLDEIMGIYPASVIS